MTVTEKAQRRWLRVLYGILKRKLESVEQTKRAIEAMESAIRFNNGTRFIGARARPSRPRNKKKNLTKKH